MISLAILLSTTSLSCLFLTRPAGMRKTEVSVLAALPFPRPSCRNRPELITRSLWASQEVKPILFEPSWKQSQEKWKRQTAERFFLWVLAKTEYYPVQPNSVYVLIFKHFFAQNRALGGAGRPADDKLPGRPPPKSQERLIIPAKKKARCPR
jgi:hypothetical protein